MSFDRTVAAAVFAKVFFLVLFRFKFRYFEPITDGVSTRELFRNYFSPSSARKEKKLRQKIKRIKKWHSSVVVELNDIETWKGYGTGPLPVHSAALLPSGAGGKRQAVGVWLVAI